MLRIDWRSPAAYEHTHKVPAAGFAWEYLRRNDDYRHEFKAITQTGRPGVDALEAFTQRWGLNFPSDPDASPERQPPIWSPRVRPQAVMLSPVQRRDDAEPIAVLAHLDKLDLRQADDGWHGVWKVDSIAHQIWLRGAAPDATAIYAATLPMDVYLELRAHAARRLWRALNGRPPGSDFRALPAQLRRWHILSLRALDARLHSESYRAIAEVLFDFHGTKEDFESDPRKNRARRLVAHGLTMMRGGYRQLLHYPIKPGKRLRSRTESP